MGRRFIVEFEEDIDVSCDDLVGYLKDGMVENGWVVPPKARCEEVDEQ